MNIKELKRKAMEHFSSDDESFFHCQAFKNFLSLIVEGATKKYGRQIKVVIMNNAGDDVTAFTDGEGVHLNPSNSIIKNLPRPMRYKAIIGHAIHEAGHLIYTDFLNHKYNLKQFLKDGTFFIEPSEKKLYDEYRSFLTTINEKEKTFTMMLYRIYDSIVQPVEDGYVDARIITAFPGYGKNRIYIREQMYNKTDALDPASKEDTISTLLHMVFFRGKFGKLKGTVTDQDALAVYSDIEPIIAKAVVEKCSPIRYSLCEDVFLHVFHYMYEKGLMQAMPQLPPQQPMSGMPDDTGDGDDQKSGSDGQNTDGSDTSDGDDQQGGSDGQSTDGSDTSDGDDQQGGSDGQSTDGSDTSDGDDQQGGSDGQSTDGSDTSDGDDQQGGSDGQSTDGSDTSDGDDQQGGSDGQNTDGSDTSDGDDQKSGSDGQSTDGSDTSDGDDQQGGSDGQSTDGSDTSDGDDQKSGSDGQNTDGSDTSDGDDQQDSSAGQNGHNIDPDELKKVIEKMLSSVNQYADEDEKMPEEINSLPVDYGDEGSEKISEPETSSATDAQNDVDKTLASIAKQASQEEVGKAVENMICDELRKSLDETGQSKEAEFPAKLFRQNPSGVEIPNEYKQYSKRIQSMLKQIIKDMEDTSVEHGLYVGTRLDTRMLSDPTSGDMCKNAIPEDTPSMAVTVLIDRSGSMAGDKLKAAKNTALLVYDFCHGMNIPVAVYAHDEDYGNSVQIVSAAEFDSIDGKDMDRIMSLEAGCCNRDGYAIRFAGKRLTDRPEIIHLLFIISDGLPNGYEYDGKKAIQDVRNAVAELRKKGCIVITAGIGDSREDIGKVYLDGESKNRSAQFLDISDLSTMPRTFVKIIEKNLLR